MTTAIDSGRYPVFAAFGENPRRLSPEEAAASVDDRIASVWHFVVGRVASFVETLKPRERASFDAEDLMIELYIKLREKDPKWASGRGRYITFAGTVVSNELSSLRDKARTVAPQRHGEAQGVSGRGGRRDHHRKAGEDLPGHKANRRGAQRRRIPLNLQ